MSSDVGEFFTPLYWGFVLSAALVGVTLIQGYMFFNRSRDPLSLQITVALMLILDISSTVVMAATIFHYFIVHFGDYTAFESIQREWVIETTLTAIVTCITQLFFATRIRMIMKEYAVFGRLERTIPGIIACTALLALVASVGKTVIIGTYSPTQLGGTQMVITTSLEEGLAFMSDLFITCMLCRILASSRGGLRRTTRPMRRLFFFILNRGILVTVLQIGALLAFVTKPGYMYWVPFHLSKSKLYTNTLLAMLNSRTQAERMASRTPCSGGSLALEDVSSGEAATHQVRSEIPDRDRTRTWDGPPVPVAPEKHLEC